ncbi:hypothetical protein [Pseudorhizobium flavum]|uniref:hypothetical protein n=1 Tax=Pseudorhizobium flavum TaxID=1335061 RepID=UPI00376FA60F
MQTWLDNYILGSSARFHEGVETKNAVYKQFPKVAVKPAPLTPLMKQASVNDGAAFRWFTELHEEGGTAADLTGVTDSEIPFRIALLPFFRDRPGIPRPLAAQLDHEVINNFRHAGITEDIRAAGTASLEDGQLVYLDLMPFTYELEIGVFKEPAFSEGIFLRAIFMKNVQSSNPEFCAVFSGRERSGHRMIGWGGCMPKAVDFIHFEVTDDGTKETRVTTDEALGATLTAIEDFTFLTLAYMQIEQENRPAPFEQLPYLPIDDPRRFGRKAKQAAKKFSLFSMVKVTGENLGRDLTRRQQYDRDPDAPPLPRDRNRRHTVRGHFRLQAVGPGWRHRRLRWIAGFDRGDINSTPVTKIRALTRHAEGQPAAPA